MPNLVDYVLAVAEDGTVSFSLAPPTTISGWTVQFTQSKRLHGTPILNAYLASGYANGQSGLTLTNGQAGQFTIAHYAALMSGRDDGCYAYTVQRIDSGFSTLLCEGFILRSP
jgi:hypothetical protein